MPTRRMKYPMTFSINDLNMDHFRFKLNTNLTAKDDVISKSSMLNRKLNLLSKQ